MEVLRQVLAGKYLKPYQGLKRIDPTAKENEKT